MNRVRKIDKNTKMEEVRRKAAELYRDGNFQQSLEVLQSVPQKSLDDETLHLLGKAAFHIQNFNLARECFEHVFHANPENDEVLRNLIDLYDSFREYRKVLHYSNLLFNLKTDHTHDVLRVLQLYRRLGLFERALELFDTLQQSGYNSELFLDEKVYLLLEIGDFEKIHGLLHPSNGPSHFSADLQRRIKRELRSGTGPNSGINLKSLYYRLHGKMLLGSFSDDGTQGRAFDSFYYDENHFYETCLRFVDFVQESQIRYRSISPGDPTETVVPRVLARILGIPFRDEPPVDTRDHYHLVIHTSFFQWKPVHESSTFHHFSFGFSYSDSQEVHFPEYIGVLLNRQPPRFYFDTRAANAERIANEIYESMHSKLHISSQSSAGRRFFSGLPEFASVRSNMIRLSANPSLKPLRIHPMEEEFSKVESQLREDGPLYLQSQLEDLQDLKLETKQVRTLLSLHKQWGYPHCSIPKFCAEKNLEQTYSFYSSEWVRTKRDPATLWIFAEVPHIGSGEFLKPLMNSSGAQLEQFLSSPAWTTLQSLKEFSPWLCDQINQTRLLPLVLRRIHELKEPDQSLINALKENVAKLDSDQAEFLFTYFIDRDVSCSRDEIQNWLKILGDPPRSFWHLLYASGAPFPEGYEDWLRSKRSDPLYEEILNLFPLKAFFNSEWLLQESSPDELLIPFSLITSREYRSLAQSMRDSYAEACEGLRFEILAYFLHNQIDPDFCWEEISNSPQRKEFLSGALMTSLEGQTNAFQDRDLLFLMEGNEKLRSQCARFFLSHGDMEFYTYLVHRMKTHASILGFEGLKTLFEVRSDQAVELLIDHALIGGGCTPSEMVPFFEWVCSDELILDEWMLLMASTTQQRRITDLKQWFLSRMEIAPKLLSFYLRFFPQEPVLETIKDGWGTFWNLEEKLNLLLTMDPQSARGFLTLISPVHRDLPQLEMLCAKTVN